ncbi:MAG TPA: UDP-glucose 4-epimerase GalE [Xanthomonadaceae bacterium]|nr:UDP-glucose 4-epimerase GalE [Xanthomonadaceae bacterium]
MANAILVCGGAGYIGSHMCRRLAQAGYLPVVFDNLSTGHREAVRWGPLVEGDLLEPAQLAELFARHRFDAVLHFAARALVSESVADPAGYLRTNLVGTLNLLDAMQTAGVDRLVFSSTCAVYGDPAYLPIDEAHPTAPVNPYGWSKLLAERAIGEYCRGYRMRAIALRYFNVAGAAEGGEIGEDHDPETHLVPNVIRAALDPSLGPVRIFGTDFPTADGTCVRDYVHVEDLCEAHLLALGRLTELDGFNAINLGTGGGHSVNDVLLACRRALDGPPEARYEARRPGDPSSLVASHALALDVLGWRPQRALDEIIASAIEWHRGQLDIAPR